MATEFPSRGEACYFQEMETSMCLVSIAIPCHSYPLEFVGKHKLFVPLRKALVHDKKYTFTPLWVKIAEVKDLEFSRGQFPVCRLSGLF